LRTIRLNPNFAPTDNNRGNIYNGKGQSDRAIADLDRVGRPSTPVQAAPIATGPWGNQAGLRRPLTEIGQDLPPCDEQAPLLQCDRPRVRC
jgi:hypothetical protein